MSYVVSKVSIDTYYGINLLHILKTLEKNPRISQIHLERFEPCLPGEIVVWETNNDVKMTNEMKNFYLSHNGFELRWHYKFGQEILPVGLIHISNLTDLALLHDYQKDKNGDVIKNNQKFVLKLGEDSKVFHLSNIDCDSRVCLIYPNISKPPSIWLWDENQNWHFLADNFMNYLRMSILHLGLPYWQYCFTYEGVPPWVQQIILMDFPHIVNRKPYDIQHRKETFIENKKNKNKKINVLDPNIFDQKFKNNKIFSENEIMKYHKRVLDNIKLKR